MKISCAMADDLLPLYVDGICSNDSKIALEEHLSACDSCRKKFDQMKNGDFYLEESIFEKDQTAGMISYAKKVRRQKVVLGVVLITSVIILALLLSLAYQVFEVMEHQRTSVISDIEDETFNLTSGELICSVDEIDEYILFTNSTQIVVSIQSDEAFSGTVMLWKADVKDDYIMVSNIMTEDSTCVFSNLSSANRYIVSIDGFSEGMVTVGGRVDFLQAVSMVLKNIF